MCMPNFCTCETWLPVQKEAVEEEEEEAHANFIIWLSDDGELRRGGESKKLDWKVADRLASETLGKRALLLMPRKGILSLLCFRP